MTKNITATRQKVGDKNFIQVILKVPDMVEEAFKDYSLQIVDYPNNETVIFVCKDGCDIDSINFRPVGNNFSLAIKDLYERIKKEK